MMVEVVVEVGLARAAVAAVAEVAVAAEVAVEKVKVEVEKGAEAAGAPGAGRSRHSRCPARKLGMESCVVRSRCNRCPEHRLRTPLQGRHRHRRRCWWSNNSCRNSYAMSSRSSIVRSRHSCNKI